MFLQFGAQERLVVCDHDKTFQRLVHSEPGNSANGGWSRPVRPCERLYLEFELKSWHVSANSIHVFTHTPVSPHSTYTQETHRTYSCTVDKIGVSTSTGQHTAFLADVSRCYKLSLPHPQGRGVKGLSTKEGSGSAILQHFLEVEVKTNM